MPRTQSKAIAQTPLLRFVVDLLYKFRFVVDFFQICYATNPQQIEGMEFALKAAILNCIL